jgi:hypothetical protein
MLAEYRTVAYPFLVTRTLYMQTYFPIHHPDRSLWHRHSCTGKLPARPAVAPARPADGGLVSDYGSSHSEVGSLRIGNEINSIHYRQAGIGSSG